MQLDYTKARQIISNSTVLFSKEQLYSALDTMASNIDAEIEGEIPIFNRNEWWDDVCFRINQTLAKSDYYGLYSCFTLW